MSVAETLKQYISENILYTGDGFPCSDDASFLESGVIDSLGVMELVMFVQTRFSIQVNPLDVTPENFDSIARLTTYIQARSEQQVPSAEGTLA